MAARLGIIMAGCAWVSLEDLMGKERMAFVIRDSGCRVVFDREKWEEAMPAGGAACNNTLDIEILDGRNDFGVLLDYNARKYDRSSMERFADIFCSICESLVRNERENTFLSQNPHFQFTNSR